MLDEPCQQPSRRCLLHPEMPRKSGVQVGLRNYLQLLAIHFFGQRLQTS
jgi:hypothetical protein